MNNVAFIYQPHYKTHAFRVAVMDQRGKEENFVVVTCSQEYNGVWKYKSELQKNFDRWNNGKVQCFVVPISDCTFVKHLHEVKDGAIRYNIIKQQKEWIDNNVRNRDYTYSSIPEWVLEEVLKL